MLDPVQLVLVASAGLAAGIVSGLFGVGGGILMVPAALFLVPGTGFHDAKAASLVVISVSAALGAWTHHRRSSVDVRTGLLLAAGGVGGSALAVVAVERVDEAALRALFGALLAATGARLALGGAPRPRALPLPRRDALRLAVGLAAGLLAGAFGIGGGILMVPALVFAGVGVHLAVGTSLLAVLGNGIVATATHLVLGYGPGLLALGVPLAIGAVPGARLGSVWAHKLHAERLRKAFGIFLALVGLGMGAQALV